MRDLLPTLNEWSETDPLVAVATVVGTSGSTPRPAGARLLVSRDGRMAGSVSGGCLESAVVLEAQATIAGDAKPRLLHYGISDEMGWAVGLSCGGAVDIFVETLESDGSDPVIETVRSAIETSRAVALLTVLDGDQAGSRAAATADGRLSGRSEGLPPRHRRSRRPRRDSPPASPGSRRSPACASSSTRSCPPRSSW